MQFRFSLIEVRDEIARVGPVGDVRHLNGRRSPEGLSTLKESGWQSSVFSSLRTEED